MVKSTYKATKAIIKLGVFKLYKIDFFQFKHLLRSKGILKNLNAQDRTVLYWMVRNFLRIK